MPRRWMLALLALLFLRASSAAAAAAAEAEDRNEEEEEGDWEYEEEEGEGEGEEGGWVAEAEEAAAVRALSELPLGRLLALRRQMGHPARAPTNWSAGADMPLRAWASAGDGSSSTEEESEGPAAMALAGRPSHLHPPLRPGGSRRGGGGGPPSWEEEEEITIEVEDEPPWASSMQQKSKSMIISKLFQGSITALAFLAFGGYLICLIVQAVKKKEQMNMTTNTSSVVGTMAMGTGPVQPLIFAPLRQRRHANKRVHAHAHTNAHAHAWPAPPPEDVLTRALYLLADGYARFSGAPVSHGP